MHTRFLVNLFEEFASEIAIIWGHEEHTYGSLIEKIKEIDQDDKKYQGMLAEPWFTNNQIPDFVQPENVLGWLEQHLP